MDLGPGKGGVVCGLFSNVLTDDAERVACGEK